MTDDFGTQGPNGFAAESVDMGVGEGPSWTSEILNGQREVSADQFEAIFREISGRIHPLTPVLRKVAPMAGRIVLGDAVGPGGADSGLVRGDPLLGDWESEFEEFWEHEDYNGETLTLEAAANGQIPGLTPEAEALAELLSTAAGVTNNEDEAAGLIGGVIIQILGPASIRVRRIIPALVGRGARLARFLRRSRSTRPFIPVISSITKATARSLAQQTSAGNPVTPATAVRTMARQTTRTLSSPNQVARALSRNIILRRHLDRRAIARAEH